MRIVAQFAVFRNEPPIMVPDRGGYNLVGRIAVEWLRQFTTFNQNGDRQLSHEEAPDVQSFA